jgi:hypothetical protein
VSHVLENETNLSHFLSGSVMFGPTVRVYCNIIHLLLLLIVASCLNY